MGPLLAANVLIVGITVTLLTVGGLRVNQRENADRIMDQRTAVVQASVHAETTRYLALLEAVAAGVTTDSYFSADAFDTATEPLDEAGLLGATSVAFVVPTPPGQVAATQRYWRTRGAPALVLSPTPDVPEHFFSVFSRALNGNSAQMNGLDTAASPQGSAALVAARRSGDATVSDTYVLLRDRGLARDQQRLSFLFAAPVFSHHDASALDGWIVLGVRGQDFLGAVLKTASQGQLDGELRATNGDGQTVTVASVPSSGTHDLHRRVALPVADREWTLVTSADSGVLPGARSSLPLLVLYGGIALTVLLSWLVWVLAGGRSRARWQVQVATAELRSAERESSRQAGLLGAIMASLGDGVGVVDEHGAFLLHNPAARALLGVPDDIDDPDDWQRHYGMYRPDGRTPFPLEEMPLVRALHGESCDGVEIMVRNPGKPDGVLLSVDGRPLAAEAAGQRGAVAVFHDITELRRYETDLSVFAGVVAHDLKAPLAVIRGHCETATEDLRAAPDSAEVEQGRQALTRIALAVDRMAGLIDTLLAFTTARDAPLRLEPVALGPLVAEVVEDRTGHLHRSSGPQPQIYLGPLPEVQVDPAMLRHVVDNLIGNALKYVQAAQVARIDVTAAPGPAGWTVITIADRGIGIPDADKPDIFDSFHRAHAAAGYAGTGLGLAICRRIVERHGGTIEVLDNPGGGTRFTFTLPLPGAAVVAANDVDRAALDRAFEERAAVENARLPELPVEAADFPAVPLRATTPQHWG